MPAFVENRATYVVDFGEIVQMGDLTGQAIIDTPDRDILGGRVTSTTYEMTFETALFPGIAHGTQIAIMSGDHQGNYGVINVNKQSDGAFSVATLQRLP